MKVKFDNGFKISTSIIDWLFSLQLLPQKIYVTSALY